MREKPKERERVREREKKGRERKRERKRAFRKGKKGRQIPIWHLSDTIIIFSLHFSIWVKKRDRHPPCLSPEGLRVCESELNP